MILNLRSVSDLSRVEHCDPDLADDALTGSEISERNRLSMVMQWLELYDAYCTRAAQSGQTWAQVWIWKARAQNAFDEMERRAAEFFPAERIVGEHKMAAE